HLVGRALEERALAGRRLEALGTHLHGHAHAERDGARIATGLARPRLDLLYPLGVGVGEEESGRAERDRMPAVTERGRAANRRIGVATDPHGDAAGLR